MLHTGVKNWLFLRKFQFHRYPLLLWQGNVFTHVCHFVYTMGVCQTPNLGRHPWARNPPLGRPSPGQTPSLGRHPLGRHHPPGRHPQADTSVGRHPSQMQMTLFILNGVSDQSVALGMQVVSWKSYWVCSSGAQYFSSLSSLDQNYSIWYLSIRCNNLGGNFVLEIRVNFLT